MTAVFPEQEKEMLLLKLNNRVQLPLDSGMKYRTGIDRVCARLDAIRSVGSKGTVTCSELQYSMILC